MVARYGSDGEGNPKANPEILIEERVGVGSHGVKGDVAEMQHSTDGR